MSNQTKSSRKTNNRNMKVITQSYKSIGKHMYRITTNKGNRYRVRMSINGVKYDEYFTNKSIAMEYRKELYSSRK